VYQQKVVKEVELMLSDILYQVGREGGREGGRGLPQRKSHSRHPALPPSLPPFQAEPHLLIPGRFDETTGAPVSLFTISQTLDPAREEEGALEAYCK